MRRERGLAPSIEAAVILPGLVLLLALVIALARVALAQHDVHAVAAHAARAAAIERTPGAGDRAVRDTVAAGIGEHGLQCRKLETSFGDSGLRKPVGARGSVAVTLRCTIGFDDLILPYLPGSVVVEAVAVSPVDSHRGR